MKFEIKKAKIEKHRKITVKIFKCDLNLMNIKIF